jgi:uncharacterized protein (DUF952 family)
MSADASAGAPATVASALPPNPSLNPPPFIYRIVPQADWEATFEKTGHYKGSPLDVKDGFIHISDKPEVAKTAALYYANEKQLVLLQLNVQEVGARCAGSGMRQGASFDKLATPLTSYFPACLRACPCSCFKLAN